MAKKVKRRAKKAVKRKPAGSTIRRWKFVPSGSPIPFEAIGTRIQNHLNNDQQEVSLAASERIYDLEQAIARAKAQSDTDKVSVSVLTQENDRLYRENNRLETKIEAYRDAIRLMSELKTASCPP